MKATSGLIIERFVYTKTPNKMTDELEIWKEIKGYEGLYEISSFGNVRSLSRTYIAKGKATVIFKPGQIVKTYVNRYVNVKLYKNTKRYSHQVHRLVAIAFVENAANKPEVNHIDGVKINNHKSNLEWCTPLENVKHAIETGLYIPGSYDCSKKVKSTNNCQPFSRNPILAAVEGAMSRPVRSAS